MDLSIILFVILILFFLLVVFLLKKIWVLEKLLNELEFAKSSQAVKHGKSIEQLFPFTKQFPFEPSSFRFIGSPIDGIVFADSEIIFVEFKTGKSKLTDRQAKIKSLVEDKKVKWLEIRN
ncbi:MAG: Holliday junction resolvase-like protein [Candidatus Diapherotrites archaeon]